ncbi:type II toxin-antitoxin system Phd/YefM family antitoxin [Sulfuricystis multivorans]|uniref:type II toxin-antitoxin system Phd/YefM family antitoxin n=1 Tax=Sulfuricystis multivorans TaxID=2211108 RepID=UPI0024DFA1AE|nr:type II toxin-antitoxin system prevent-host-death family antitoxin [Sulfuricystis multivorans]
MTKSPVPTTAMPQFNIAEAKTHLSELVQKALMGEEVIIARDNKPQVKIVPLKRPAGKRVPGSGKDQIRFISDDFDATPADFADYV